MTEQLRCKLRKKIGYLYDAKQQKDCFLDKQWRPSLVDLDLANLDIEDYVYLYKSKCSDIDNDEIMNEVAEIWVKDFRGRQLYLLGQLIQ